MSTKLMSVSEAVRERTSIKTGYLPNEISEQAILSLLDDAVWAPNHGLREPWRFILVTNQNKQAFIEAATHCYTGEKREKMYDTLNEVPAFLVVVMKEDPRHKIWEEDYAATSALIQNFQLVAWEKEIGVVWKTPDHILDPKFRQALGVQPGEKIVGVLHIGYFDKSKVPTHRKRTPAAQKLTVF